MVSADVGGFEGDGEGDRQRVEYSHPPKASYGVASPRRTTAYCLRRRALSETFGGWL